VSALRVAFDVTAIPPKITGAGVFVARLVEALAARDDIALDLVTRRDDAERWRPHGIVHAVAPSTRPARLAWEQARAPGVARRIGAPIWHGPHYTMPARCPVPAVVTVHDLTFFEHPEWHERSKALLVPRLIRESARRAAAIVCVSDRTAARLEEHAPVRGRTVVIPHGVDHERFRPSDDVDGDLERIRALGVEPPFVVHLGTIEPRKNVAGLVRAFARVREAHPDLRLVLAGVRGWGVAEVDSAIERAGLAASVVRLGYVADDAVPSLLRRAAAVGYPAFEEGFGLPALEGLACGAVVVTTSGTVMEDVTGGAAILSPPGDDVALANALLRAVAGGPDVDALRVAGPGVAAAYTWDGAAAAHADLYRSL
jgi:glycosyltransferase involved in cell wall biosynthesis